MTLKGMSEDEYKKLSREELIKLLEQQKPRVRLKIGNKGGLSVSGLGQRFPTTLYKDSWLLLLSHADEIRQFIKDHDKELVEKEPTE